MASNHAIPHGAGIWPRGSIEGAAETCGEAEEEVVLSIETMRRLDLLGKGTTVGELIEALRKFPLAQRVMVRGYESGYDDPQPLQVILVQPDPYDSRVYGNYEEGDKDGPHSFSVVLIDRP
jgi:hypothetical protein